jgi:hypothetical protein
MQSLLMTPNFLERRLGEVRRIILPRLSEKRFERLSKRGFGYRIGRKGVSRGISASGEVPFRAPPGLFGQSRKVLFSELRVGGVLRSSDAGSCIALGTLPLALRRRYSARGGAGGSAGFAKDSSGIHRRKLAWAKCLTGRGKGLRPPRRRLSA